MKRQTNALRRVLEGLLPRVGRQRAKRRFLERIRNAPDRATSGKIQWTRDELHER